MAKQLDHLAGILHSWEYNHDTTRHMYTAAVTTRSAKVEVNQIWQIMPEKDTVRPPSSTRTTCGCLRMTSPQQQEQMLNTSAKAMTIR